ncbi:flagellar hook assembly protein FlgD [Robertmurraya andreesenii]|uniref:Basal-body rod modification protein FlgD n=1 Tax=Anoxybacillus andreesenii TaxID=1325932 RepID=A0ABT9V792_9BACL|nr:flagellar hook assembly protein FlgD [Robertmurraya andreesenii]MDQ0156811.1 flagellar basal-body rod modification protein FlgD [Robertmurraya andreesenii]
MTNTIDPSLLLSEYQNSQRKTGSNTLGKDDFLKLLITQLANQDPTNPMQDREFISQMAQFSSLEQMTNMNNTMQKFIDSQQQNTLIAYNQFIGKEITWHRISYTDEKNPKPVIEEGTGKVVSLQFKDNNVYFILEDGTKLEPGNVSQINSVSSENQLTQASLLIGKTVTYKGKDNEELVAQVKSVFFKDGKTFFQLNDENNTNITASQITKIE